MLKRVGDREFPGKTEVFIKEASFPVPFQPGHEVMVEVLPSSFVIVAIA